MHGCQQLRVAYRPFFSAVFADQRRRLRENSGIMLQDV